MFQNPNLSFTETYRCYPVTFMSGNERENVNYGGKIILPPTALAKLAGLNIEYPMLFELRNTNKQRHSHAGVLEFIAEEGRVYLPYWMMQTLLLSEGDLIEIKNTTLPLGTFVKIQPQSPDFLDISDPKAVLENSFRNFSTLTQGDVIQIYYNNKTYEIMVLEVRSLESPNNPSIGISIVETDLEVDFAPPVGYVEPKPQPKQSMVSLIRKLDLYLVI
ncbi:ubiquitin fusion degradation protein UFD1 [Glomus cerebriforme]|uniref:Ubiquitin fusion degradation protein 1 n=1 Tax=Glomus cerebriforme TaxID=658196 RepID=A0A397SV91_9GLOM|nr:ubiquitin fusion degradation protein UFD1 [Glomus cerebriforme]